MDLQMDVALTREYHSAAQQVRVITEDWVNKNVYCPYCGNMRVEHYENNKPVADFYCAKCEEDYELKSKKEDWGKKIVDGEYQTMISRIMSLHNPNFFFMRYDKNAYRVKDLFMVPRYFFSPEIIEKRKPLSPNARRAGWTGCNILIRRIPPEGRIAIIENEIETPVEDVIAKVNKTGFIKKYKLDARGWILDVLNCINMIDSAKFSLDQVYQFELYLSQKHPENHHIKDKIRQQLQVLRDKGIIEFNGRGVYTKVTGNA